MLLQGITSLCSALVILQVLTTTTSATSQFECSQSGDCSQSQCCLIGMMRFSTPSCQSYGQIGDNCRMDGSSQNMTLTYPNGLILTLTDSYTLFCPCDPGLGLVCHRAQCMDPATIPADELDTTSSSTSSSSTTSGSTTSTTTEPVNADIPANVDGAADFENIV